MSSPQIDSPSRGSLVMVVGPSGAGKDTLIAHARQSAPPSVVFVRRAITRPPSAGPEDHEAMTDAEFATAEAHGAFLLTWRSHGLAYGLPKSMGDDLAAGRVVVANVSRTIIPATARLPCRRLVVNILASPAILAQRIGARGREAATAIQDRLSRSVAIDAAGAELVVIRNDGPVEAAGEALAALLRKEADLSPAAHRPRC